MVGGLLGDALMEVAFRVDASTLIGSGHVMRCLTLAEVLADAGARCYFVMREKSGSLEKVVRSRGHQVLMLSSGESGKTTGPSESEPTHANWLGVSWETDASETVLALKGIELDWLVVDHYALDCRWESQVGECSKRLMVIDDLADRTHHCDLLLDQNLGREPHDYAGLVPDYTKRLIGSDYALLRPEFARARALSVEERQTREPGSILVSMGGVDAANVTGDVLRVLDTIEVVASCRVTVVLGAACPHIDEVIEQADSMHLETRIVVNATNMAELMGEADLAIGAAGGSAWERCCLGLPTLLVVMAENQLPGAEALERAGASISLGWPDAIEGTLPRAVLEVMAPERLLEMSQNSAAICDGLGAQRVADALEEVSDE
ncbi:UDP-2,4-diacetamido-2,4,6-trideoxy-beta-L-altropyranose hydrolase [Marinobacter sp.]|jgi:UDP-2,4-diacetamido-2,4,6-trideoxy-beta-L-altropyranose hydrolase|uniref:UDP-2,4-diacetamido-2,4, 6-trideoxy-beta-L-altropyranose hydrolase n=1 Tax=Marinobacter sp. TaxID=50741 RepID=UPI000C8D7D00|nr:UDP-2,4-diacetamido-2,4,6-trideoxy-beta-L-altropyranose hydrolase [Marinobacter sp.]MAK51980.1 UDP-2,4-diacetamido-2,4,6-trideoxy-beta-L-altropyranose hydrolase [Marinobacter sp.]|tara:strand:- start:4593 stop:5726 length:1134 start_codon:yes stop_codon:yes gene_type:complete